MSHYCGQCRQFTRKKGSADFCSAWGQPTFAKKQACGYFMPMISKIEQVKLPLKYEID
ncbi:hypothetical protein [Vibrio alfacsensis]|uniref:hypothetical protein n=1 Tax=Vibrio alfacsensis TaxID=1074311 RepID=UPI001BF17A7A|nr:hypothetical protein [Vibrio alfacsensis]BCN25949.1 hypothetical protein VYA_31410 [Vibrio alfacsensis]